MADEISAPRNKAGQLAWVLHSATEIGKVNIGLIVTVVSCIGHMNEGDIFEVRGIRTKAPITDTYWWISAPHGFNTPYGPMSQCMSPDKWLMPIPPDLLDTTEETGAEVYDTIPADTADID